MYFMTEETEYLRGLNELPFLRNETFQQALFDKK